MDLRLALYELAHGHRLDARSAGRLQDLAGLRAEPLALKRWLPVGIAVLAAALAGLGLVFWIAANWDGLGRFGRFAVLQAAVLAACLGAAWRPALRAPLALLALLATGGLFAYFGQTYQTGADPWQLFALWAVLTLPLCLALRSDVLWAPWALVTMTAVSLWVQAHTGHQWRVEPGDLLVHLVGWCAALAVVGALAAPARRVSGAGPWALRSAATLAVVIVTATALGGLFSRPVGTHYAFGLVVLAAGAVFFAWRRAFDVFALSAVALGLNTLLVAGLARLLFENPQGGDSIGNLLLLGLAAAGLLAVSVNGVLKLARQRDAQGQTPASLPGQPRGADGRARHEADPARHADLPGVVRAAIAEGLLPASATVPSGDSRPWPVVLLTALGAWLATVPLLGVVGLLLGDLISRSVGPYLVGVLMLVGAIVVLRSREVPLFVEQLAVPALLVGGGALGFGLFRDLPSAGAAAVLAVVSLAVGLVLRGPWLRVLMGAAAVVLFVVAATPQDWHQGRGAPLESWWLAWHGALAAWLLAMWAQARGLRDGARAQAAAALESIAAGWLLATLAGLAWWAGMSFLVGGSFGGGLAGDVARGLGQRAPAQGLLALQQAASAALALAAAAWASRRWPALQRAWLVGVALVLVVLAWFMPALGAVLLALALCVTSRRWTLAAAAAAAAAWIVGAFYYQLDWPLSVKALALVAAGAALGALAWWGASAVRAAQPPGAQPAGATALGAARWGIAASALAVLVVANVGIWQKERLIATGRPVYVELAPADPRSLMQGDFMRLNFRLPGELQVLQDGTLVDRRPQAVARVDARGVATLLRVDTGTPLGADELRVELTPKDGRWILVSDAWFFREGDAARWAKARYGEFRVDAQGRALLVGLRGAELEAL